MAQGSSLFDQQETPHPAWNRVSVCSQEYHFLTYEFLKFMPEVLSTA
jgi:hypothetical protein